MAKRNSSDGDGRNDSGRRGRPGRSQRSTPRSGNSNPKFKGKKDSHDSETPRKRSSSSEERPSSPKKSFDKRSDSFDKKRSDFSGKKRTSEDKSAGSRGRFSKDRNEGFSGTKREGGRPRTDRRDGPPSEGKKRFSSSDEVKSGGSKERFSKDRKEGFSGAKRESGKPRTDRRDGPPSEGKKRFSSSGNARSGGSNERFSKDRKERFSGSKDRKEGYSDAKKKGGRFPMDRRDGPPAPGKKRFGGPSERPNNRNQKSEQDRTSQSKDKSFDRPRIGKKNSSAEEPYSPMAPVQTEQIRLNRYIANSGVCSRREADELITMGLISVNGKTITEMGYKVNPGDVVRYEDRVLKAERPVYILLNKPKGYLTTTSDPQERNTVMHLVANAVKERVYPVGRLDRNTTGLLLLTNDGDLADKLMHPSYNVKKIYKIELDRPLAKIDLQKLQEGIELEEGKAMVDDIAIVSEDGKTVGVELHIGWNRVVRRLFESLDYQVVKLDRSVYAGLDKKDLPRGHWRFLRKEEIIRLKHYK